MLLPRCHADVTLVIPVYRFVGKNHLENALKSFHDEHPSVALALNVTRKPFSFLGQQPADKDERQLKRKGIWHDRLMDYAGSPA